MSAQTDRQFLVTLAQIGALTQMQKHQDEIDQLQAFLQRYPIPVPASLVQRPRKQKTHGTNKLGRRTRAKMTPAERRAVSARMKKYWAAKRRAAKR